VRQAKKRNGGVARAAAIDGGEWTGARSASVAGGARLQAPPRRDRDPSSAPARGGSAVAALVSLVVHAAIVVAAALSLGAPQPTGEPDAVAVELVASTGETPAPAIDADLKRATRAARDDAKPAGAAPSAPPSDAATPVPAGAAQAMAPQPTEASDAETLTPAKAPDAAVSATPKADADATPTPTNSAAVAEATDETPPAPLTQDPTPEAAPAAVASAPASSPQSASARPEADFVAAPAAPHVESKLSAKPPTAARPAGRLEPTARPSGARAATRAASAPAPARGAAELAAYRDALLAKISGAARYPEAARERGATGVATVRFALDGGGGVTLADLAQSSGDRALDDEALAAVRRASPLPAPPVGAPRAYSAPIRFELR
jgi:protein TonB